MDLLPQMMFASARRMWLCLFVFLLLTGVDTARLHAQVAGSVDTGFTTSIFGGLNVVNCSALQPDGKVVIGGSFTEVDGFSPSNMLNNLARLNPDGTLDLSFVPGSGPNGPVNCVAVQADGKLIVGGSFTKVNGQAAAYLCRLNANGSLDTGFTTGIVGGPVLALAIQSNGAIVVGGNFSTVVGTTQTNLTRLNSNGTIDTTFWHGVGTNAQVNTLVVQPNGSILIGGAFTTLQEQEGTLNTGYIARLFPDGTFDATFHNNIQANNAVQGTVLLPSGKVVIFGSFTSYSGIACAGIAQLTSTGTVDTTANFNPGTGPSPAGTINSIALQTDGKLIVAGNFTSFSGSLRTRLIRLSSTGALESTTTFNPVSIDAVIDSVSLQGNGEMIIGGSFGSVGSSNGVALLKNTSSTQTLAASGSTTVTWSRSNACPEVWNATFELSTDQGTTWTSLGAVSRISGGWQLTGLSLPASGYLRARGQATGGSDNGGLGLLEQVQGFGGASSSLPVASLTGVTLTATSSIEFGVTYGATLNGTVNGLGNNGKVSFQYGPFGLTSSAAAAPFQVGGSTLTPVSATITNLQPGTTYHYELTVQVGNLTAGSTMGSFTTLNDVDTLSSLSVNGATLTPPFEPFFLEEGTDYNAVLPSTATSATINLPTTDPNATVTVNGVAVPAGTGSAVVAVSPGNNLETIVVTAQDGLTTNTYYVTVTVATTPTAATAPADVSDVFATLKGLVAAMDTSATVTFQYGPTTSYGSTISGGRVSGGFNTSLGATITGLTPGSTYHYQVTVTNSQGSATSNDEVFTTYLTPPPGSIDSTFNASATFIQATATQPNGQIIVGGFFSTVDGVAATNLARLNADGTRDTTFNPSTVQNVIDCIAVQPNGQILVGGSIATNDGTTSHPLVRLNPDGSPDTTFALSLDNSVSAIALQANGQIVIGGDFSTVNGVAQKYLARLNADGSLDTSFVPAVDVFVSSVVIQTNQQIMVGGWFSTVNGTATSKVARLNADGTTDSSFVTTIDNPVNCLAVQPNGQIVIGGWFTKVDGDACSNLARLNADGTRDTSFNPHVDQQVFTVALQTNGQILPGGVFQNVAATPRNYLARLNADGTLDTLFNPDANAPVYSIAPRADGEVLIGGEFNTMFGQLHSALALVLNDPASQSVFVPDLTQIQWARGGSEPEVNLVTFDLSTDGGNTWNNLGAGTRVTGGWQLTGLSLPASGLLRARGVTIAGEDTGSSGIIEQDWAYPPAPQIVVQLTGGAALTSGSSTVDFGQLLPGASASQTFTVSNPGNATLTGLAVTFSGGNSNDFSLLAPPATSVAPGGNTTFTIQFAPGSTSAESTTLQLASNVSGGANPFLITLTGTGITPLQAWRLTWFGTTSDTGNAADTAMPAGDGVPNLLKFATGLNPTQSTAAPGRITLNGNQLIFTYPRSDAAAAAGLTYVVEWTTSLQPATWSSTGITETILSDNGAIQQVQDVIPVTGGQPCFVHLRVTY